MKDAHPSDFRQIGGGPWARARNTLRGVENRAHVMDFVVCAVLSALVVLMARSEGGLSRTPTLREGSVAPFTVRAPHPIEVEDRDQLESERAGALVKVPDVYDFDPSAVAEWSTRWKEAVRFGRQKFATVRDVRERFKGFQARLRVPIGFDEYRVLERLDFSGDLERSVAFALAPLWDKRISEGKVSASKPAELIDLKTRQTWPLSSADVENLLTLDEARAFVGRAARDLPKGRIGSQRVPWDRWPKSSKTVVFEVQSRLVVPNMTFNRQETEARRTTAEKDLHPAFRKLERGEVIVREGERVTKEDAQILKLLSEKKAFSGSAQGYGAQVLFGALTLWLLCFFVRRQFPAVLRNTKDSVVAAAFLIASLAALKVGMVFQMNVIAESLPSAPEAFLVFALPAAAPAMTVRLLVSRPLTAFFVLLYAIFASLVLGKGSLFGAFVLLSGIVGASLLGRCRTRSALYRAGLYTALVCGVGAACLLGAWDGKIPFSTGNGVAAALWSSMLWAFAGGCLGGWFSSALTMILVPIFESLLDYTTDLKLLELARMDHPLLRDLVLKAPGTYHHSIIVGSLVEAGADAIGANALLARVGSYYHDIGKIGRAEYFVENQGGGLNPHDHTTPQLSAKIIISHVKEGIVMAEQYKLGGQLIDFIRTHHGTSVVSYFFNKAKQEAAQPGSPIRPEDVSEDDFRYPGPKPRTKEHAIVSLADACEASTRSLVDPTPARLEGMVNKIFMKGFTEGLLEEADITLEELHLVAKAFLRILLGIHHNRIQYPDQEKGLPARPVLKASGR